MTDFIDKIICSDCLEVMPTIEDTSVDMILADLPYGVTACKWDTLLPLADLWLQFERITKPNAAMVFTATQPFVTTLINSNPKQFKYEWIWYKTTASGIGNAKIMPMRYHENIIVFYRESPIYNKQPTLRKPTAVSRVKSNSGIKSSVNKTSKHYIGFKDIGPQFYDPYYINPKSVLEFDSVYNHNKTRLHPTQKPVELFEYLIRTYTNEGDTVLDPTCGSGTTAVACKRSNRHYICIEKEPEYCAIAEKRLAEML